MVKGRCSHWRVKMNHRVSVSVVGDMTIPSPSFQFLRDFLTNRMRMSHIYQPLMIRTLLTRGGRATIRQIASKFLSKDESQLEYYEEITKNMPGRVLARHGIAKRL